MHARMQLMMTQKTQKHDNQSFELTPQCKSVCSGMKKNLVTCILDSCSAASIASFTATKYWQCSMSEAGYCTRASNAA